MRKAHRPLLLARSRRDFLPGDIIIALGSMRSWESPYERGKDGRTIEEGQTALYLSCVETDGNKRRLVVLFDGQMAYFSSDIRHTSMNWVTLVDYSASSSKRQSLRA